MPPVENLVAMFGFYVAYSLVYVLVEGCVSVYETVKISLDNSQNTL